MARALLLACGLATLWMATSGRLWDQPAPLVVGALPQLLWICTWQVFRSGPHRVAHVPLRDRARSALAGSVAVLTAALLLWIVVPALAPAVDYYPERTADSRARLGPEALGVILLGTVTTVFLPAPLYVREARDPVGAIVSWACLPVVPLVVYWAPLMYSVTHVGSPGGWGRLVLLTLAYGLGWVATAGRASSRAALPAGRELATGRMGPDLLYVTLVALALLVATFVVGRFLRDPPGGLHLYPLVVVLVSLLSLHWQAPRSDSNVAELARAVFLSIPLLVVLAAAARVLVAAPASRTVPQPGLLLVPVPFAAVGTLWLLGVCVIATVRLGLDPPVAPVHG